MTSRWSAASVFHLDGFVAGPDQSMESPLGVRGPELMDWFFPTRLWQQMQQAGQARGRPVPTTQSPNRAYLAHEGSVRAAMIFRLMQAGRVMPYFKRRNTLSAKTG